MNDILSTPIASGVTIGDLLTIQFLASVIGNVLVAILIVVLAFMISGWVRRRIIGIAARYKRIDDTLFAFLGNVARYAILTFAAVFVLNRFGVQTASLVAIIGAAGLAIGLALQGTLSNIAAGVMMVIFRPFRVGDFVEVAGHSGTVKDISIVMTELATTGNVQIIIPNSDVWGSAITNYSAYPLRNAEWIFGVGYGADLARAEQVIRDTILSDPRAHANPEPFIQVRNLGDSSVDFTVRVWCDRAEFFKFHADMTRAVKEAFDANGIDIPFPTRTLVQARAEEGNDADGSEGANGVDRPGTPAPAG
ncbi:mechanosensitive ion channel protein MscS [Brevirhabdus pacifica]|uniref:Small-conductance mechanosensitive channel n=1 Tax=Brevirhabdus pacifica TaxID=1267768 RepID=A0A1U7DJJ7_9RHOB|nr:mechanosensitive ion channel domain-containing protein [Brevirhabdus pacifica]APX90059.1 mechanosensitive ion channel protein MscS [Brevirhabdus pacifica]OWU75349.1 mechanosensitive ion channel protein MscS [Loktanella sp. 22II-4b]PJJ82689.1 small conductance mechanosensitive channel [Brevirhabdus pacifica]